MKSLTYNEKWFLVDSLLILRDSVELIDSIDKQMENEKDRAGRVREARKAVKSKANSTNHILERFSFDSIEDLKDESIKSSNVLKEKSLLRHKYRRIIQKAVEISKSHLYLGVADASCSIQKSAGEEWAERITSFALTERERIKYANYVDINTLMVNILKLSLEIESEYLDESKSRSVGFMDKGKMTYITINSNDEITSYEIEEFIDGLAERAKGRHVANSAAFLKRILNSMSIIKASKRMRMDKNISRESYLRKNGLSTYMAIRDAVKVTSAEIDLLKQKKEDSGFLIDLLIDDSIEALENDIALLKSQSSYNDENRQLLIEKSTEWRANLSSTREWESSSAKQRMTATSLVEGHILFIDRKLTEEIAIAFGAKKRVERSNVPNEEEEVIDLIHLLKQLSEVDVVLVASELMSRIEGEFDTRGRTPSYTKSDFLLESSGQGYENEVILFASKASKEQKSEAIILPYGFQIEG